MSAAGSQPPPPVAVALPAGALRHHAVVGLILAVLTSFHFATNPHAVAVHDLLFKATFVPLILAGLWFRPRVALIWSALTSCVYLWHVFGDLSGHGHDVLWGGDIVLYNVVTGVTSVLSRRTSLALAESRHHARAVEANARALLRAEETLRRTDRLRAVGELAAGMAHEIRNPLGGILGATEVLERESTPADVRSEFWALLRSEVERLDGVVTNFLNFARPPTPEVSAVSVRALVAAVFLLVRPECAQRRVICENLVADDTTVRADESLLRQILLNLVLNAVQAQADGGFVRVEATRDEERVSVAVGDGGPGVPESLRATLFDAYVTGRSEGTGLGLAVAVRLAESMGAGLELAATGAAGTTFRISLTAA